MRAGDMTYLRQQQDNHIYDLCMFWTQNTGQQIVRVQVCSRKHLDVRILLLQIPASASDSTTSAHTSNQDVNLAF